MSGPKVLQFPGNDRIVTDDAYQRELESPETLESVRESIADICQLGISQVATLDTDDVRLVRAKGDLSMGTVHHVRGEGKRLALISHTNFPRTLNTEMGLLPVDALQVAARFTVAYGLAVVRDTGRSRLRRLSFADSLNTDLWSGGFTDEYPTITLAYRAAGCIALYSQGRPNIGRGELQPPYPPHIAGLLNHLLVTQTRQLHPIFKA